MLSLRFSVPLSLRPSVPLSLCLSVALSPRLCVALWLSWDNRQRDRGRTVDVVVDRLVRFDHLRRAEGRLARVVVAIEAREIAARDVDANPVSGLEDVARRPQVNHIFVDFIRLYRLRALGRIAITR